MGETEYFLHDLLWAPLSNSSTNVRFWPAKIVRPRPQVGNFRFWRFHDRVHVEYFRCPSSVKKLSSKRLKNLAFLMESSSDEVATVPASKTKNRTGWVKERDVAPFEPFESDQVRFNDYGLQKAFKEANIWFKSKKKVPPFVRSQVKHVNRFVGRYTKPGRAEEESQPESRLQQKVETLKAEANECPKYEPGEKVELVKAEMGKAKTASSGWSRIMCSMRSAASVFPFGPVDNAEKGENVARTPTTTKRKRQASEGDEEKENSNHDNSIGLLSSNVMQRTANKVRRVTTTARQYSADEITEEMLNSIPSRVKDKKKPVTDADKEAASTCHQCRQKTMDLKSICRNQEKVCRGAGRICAICLRNIYGQDIKEALKNPSWKCPSCSGKCVCSVCMKRQGLQPNGPLAKVAKENGFASVTEYVESGKKVIRKIVETIF